MFFIIIMSLPRPPCLVRYDPDDHPRLCLRHWYLPLGPPIPQPVWGPLCKLFDMRCARHNLECLNVTRWVRWGIRQEETEVI